MSNSARAAIGCMRLSTAPDRDDEAAIAVVHAALDAGAAFLDTADAYCHDERDIGHNERLIARALSLWPGDRARIVVATKGGLTRPGGAWVPDGRAKHLAEACDASLRALGVERIDLYQLHAPDPRTPFATSVRALAALQRAGKIRDVGLCNVNLRQLREAQEITAIDAVQVELNPWHDHNVQSGVVDHCIREGIRVIAHRPLGGVKRQRALEKDPIVQAVARRHDATPQQVVLAWIADLDRLILPLPGPSRIETARSCAEASRMQLTDEDRTALDQHFPTVARLRRGSGAAAPAVHARTDGEVVLVMGLPAAGKSTLARDLTSHGYARLNRDDAGGSLEAIARALDDAIAGGTRRVVLDNTYVSRRSRAPVLAAAAKHGVPVRGLWLNTTVEEAQVNATSRMLERYGRLLDPLELGRIKDDPGAFAPNVLFRYQRETELPELSEGFAQIETLAFNRAWPAAFTNRALFVRADEVRPDRAEVLRRFADNGWAIVGLGWQPDIAAGATTAADIEAAFARTRDALGVAIDFRYCPHPAGPPICWCRRPMPGLAVVEIHARKLAPSRCVYVGSSAQDPAFARRLGFEYRHCDAFSALGPVENP